MDEKAISIPSPLQALLKDYFFWVLLGLLVLLTVAEPGQLTTYPTLVDWPTIAALTGLLVLTKGVELSGYLHHLGKRLILRMPTDRAVAILLVLIAAMLSTLLTNDVALFIVVPLTVGLRAVSTVPVTRLIVFEALAVNAGSALTPIGNPQNLFLSQLSQLSFYEYTGAMLPLALILLVPLLLLTTFTFTGRSIVSRDDTNRLPLNKRLLYLSLALYLPFLVCIDSHQAEAAVVLVLVIFLVIQRQVLARVDWTLILVFILMFVDMRLIARDPIVNSAIEQIGLSDPQRIYFAGIIISQLISNVPTAILLAEYSDDWKLIAYAVNVGGFGFILGSLANIIALRMAHDGRAWLTFHAFSLPVLLVASGLVYLWLFVF
ncbi:SLC13 family permease [Nitrosospira sp. NRS527]|uniref:SLC13 family permease n=1 Tax=Nitrosospira sp. NRS527 TaxID=155925 RepID=UPI001AF59B16|nr:SLC13 family permease [Nitrosospira sp. NRS527]BCT67348.1 Inner membrane protein YbiR [Nitrosospira sp. NRS527]